MIKYNQNNNQPTLLTQDVNISFEDVVSYWMTLFPELNNEEELEKILKNTSNTNFKEMKSEYFIAVENNLDDLFNALDGQEHIDSLLDDIFGRVRQTFKWAYFYKPVIGFYAYGLYRALSETNIIYDMDELFKDIVQTIINSLYPISYKTLVLETNIARMDGRLEGSTPIEKSSYFADVLLTDREYLRSIYEEYSELTRLMRLKTANICSYIKDVVTYTRNHYDNLVSYFSEGKELGKIKDLSLGEGDSHNNGKTVARLLFTSGVKLIFKPRSLEIEEGYFNFIDWINKQSIENFLPIKAPKVYYTNNAGWMEFIEPMPCEETGQVRHFYNRIGQLLCMLYILNSKDFHYENLIAHTGQPVLIDLETIYHPEILNIDLKNSGAYENVTRKINNSVKGIALLPTQVVNQKNGKTLEVGGLSNKDKQSSPFRNNFIKDFNSDEISIEAGYGYVELKDNNPSLDGETLNSENFTNEIKEGFTYTYKWIKENKDVLVDKIRDCFKNSQCRVVYRPTNLYAQLLTTSYHPDLLRNTADRKIYLHRIGLVTDENLKEISYSEFLQMQNSDVPYFSAYLTGNQLLNSDNEVIISLPMGPALNVISEKIESLNDEDLEWQLAIIDYSYTSDSDKNQNCRTSIKFKNSSSSKDIGKRTLFNGAKTIGDFILDRSIYGNKDGIADRTWIGSVEIVKDHYDISCVGNDLYSGNSGIALFLACLGVISGEEKYRIAAIEAINPVAAYIEDVKDFKNERIGFFSGVSGWIYSVFYIGIILNNSRLIDIAYKNITAIENLIDNDNNNCDIISGISGSMGALLAIYGKTDDAEIKQRIVRICNRLYEILKQKAIVLEDGRGITWGEEGFVGFSHGNAGVVSQIFRLFKITNDVAMLETVNSSLCYERSMFLKEKNNWRKQLTREGYSNSWCHGAPGILTERLQLYKSGYSDNVVRDEISIAVETVKRDGFGNDYCLCHGDMGNLLILNEAAMILKDESLKSDCLATAMEILHFCEGEVKKSPISDRIDNLNLMTGLSGAGYGLLKFCSPEIIPNILFLD